MSINEVLHNIQVSLTVPKTRYNKFGGYNYRSAEDIVDAVKALLSKEYVLTLSDEIIMLGNRFYIKAEASLTDGAERIAAYGYAREPQEQKGMGESQITGAASSYARKYALNGLFAIDDGVDADSQNDHKVTKVANPDQKLDLAKKKASQIISEYRASKDLNSLVEVQAKYHNELRALSDRYLNIFDEVNKVGLEVIGGFNDKL